MLDLAGAGNLDGKVRRRRHQPARLLGRVPADAVVKDDDSLGEQLQRAHPGARVVKALNTMNASVMVRPDSLSEPTTAFVAGDDAEAKAAVTGLLEDFGHTDVIDLGDISMARGAEMFLPLWVRLMGSARDGQLQHQGRALTARLAVRLTIANLSG